MRGALYFIIYPNAAGDGNIINNISLMTIKTNTCYIGVTVSVRTASTAVQPLAIQNAPYQVFDNSINNGIMTANIRYYGTTWVKGGSVDVTSTKESWIWALGPGTSINSDDVNEDLQLHSKYGNFVLDMSAAKMEAPAAPVNTPTSSANEPEQTSATEDGSNDGASTISDEVASPTATATSPQNTAASTNNPTNNPFPLTTAKPESISNGQIASSTKESYQGLLVAHAILLSIVFIFLLPIGVVVLRLEILTPMQHGYLQTAGLLLAIIGFGIACVYSTKGYGNIFDKNHQIIGILLIILFLVQPVIGFVRHRQFLQEKDNMVRKVTYNPTVVGNPTVINVLKAIYEKHVAKPILSICHIWLGRLIIVLGSVNAILGFQLAGNNKGALAIGLAASLWILLIYFVVARKTWNELNVDNSNRSPLSRSISAPIPQGKSYHYQMGGVTVLGGLQNMAPTKTPYENGKTPINRRPSEMKETGNIYNPYVDTSEEKSPIKTPFTHIGWPKSSVDDKVIGGGRKDNFTELEMARKASMTNKPLPPQPVRK